MFVIIFDLFVQSLILLHGIFEISFILEEISLVDMNALDEQSGLFELSHIAHVFLHIVENVLFIERPVPSHPEEQNQKEQQEKYSHTIQSVHHICYILVNEQSTFDINGSRERKEDIDSKDKKHNLK